MKRPHKTISLAASTLAIAVLLPSIASAHGFGMISEGSTAQERAQKYATMFEQYASILGIPVAEAKQYWSEGKTMREIAEVKGITQEALMQKIQVYRTQEQKTRLQELVSAGVITQAQADARLSALETRKAQFGSGKGGRRDGHCGMGMIGN
jgi:predicted DNA-binding protein YlxM (UPF0122 family)